MERLSTRLVGLLQTSRRPTKHHGYERLDTPSHQKVLLATLAQRQRTPSGLSEAGHPTIAGENRAQQSRSLENGAAPRASRSPQQPRAQEIWVHHAKRPRVIKHTCDPTAGCGKPHVRWCGSPDGRKSRQGDPIDQNERPWSAGFSPQHCANTTSPAFDQD